MADPSKPVDDTDPAVADTHASEPGAADTQAPPSAAATGRLSRARAIRPGDTLGRYEIGDELGEGGMATVFKARDTQLRREVAVKVLFPHLAKRDEIVRRFQREARAAAGLEHANILRIYDVGGAEGEDPPYIVMEIVRGRSLLQEMEQRGPMFPEVVACIGALLADALAAAHAASIVHRDIKPANVMIAANGRLLLADFGVARLETEDSSLVTKTGALLGTPAYMSPEQASGDTATAKSDLYSLGATLYQLATGSLPYAGSPAKVLAQIASGALVAPAKRKPSVGPDLSRAIEKLMQTEAEQRTASAAVAAAELRALAAAAGFGEPADELAAYFADPAAFVAHKTPAVLAHTLAAGHAALAEGKLPRAMALADRANALAPADPAVAALIEKVSAGGASRGRRRAIAYAALGLVLAGGGTVAALAITGVLGGRATTTAGDAPGLARDADPQGDAAATSDARGDDAAPVVSLPVDAVLAREDAGTRVRDAAIARDRDASTRDANTVARVDGALAALPDASPIDAAIALPVDAAIVKATLVVTNNLWCDVFVDGDKRGQFQPGKPLRVDVDPGRHEVTCSQPTIAANAWTRTVDAAPGEQRVQGAFDLSVELRLEVDTTIDDAPHRAGEVVKVKRGTVKIGSQYRSISVSCTVRKDLQCYQ